MFTLFLFLVLYHRCRVALFEDRLPDAVIEHGAEVAPVVVERFV